MYFEKDKYLVGKIIVRMATCKKALDTKPNYY